MSNPISDRQALDANGNGPAPTTTTLNRSFSDVALLDHLTREAAQVDFDLISVLALAASIFFGDDWSGYDTREGVFNVQNAQGSV